MFAIRMKAFGTALATVVMAAIVPAGSAAQAPDLPARTPVARSSGSVQATASTSRSRLRAQLSGLIGQAGSGSGAWVYDVSGDRSLFGRKADVARTPASNMKLFTTGVALRRMGPTARLRTSIWAVGKRSGSTLDGRLFLVGAGDPALASSQFGRRYVHGVLTPLGALAPRVRTAGITKVTGRLLYDDTIFDRRRGVPASNYRTSIYIGPLSGLDYNSGFAGSSTSSGFAGDPATVAAHALDGALRKRGVAITRTVARGKLPAPGPRVVRLGAVLSPALKVLTRETDRYSNNFFAEMLLKGLGARFGGAGTTRAGALFVKRVALKAFGARPKMLDGSGLDHSDRVSPHDIGRLLKRMLADPAHRAFVGSLPLAGHQGTVKFRMRGTAADGRCRTKTGTLTGVSALSGYCFNRSGRTVVFSILMNGVGDLNAAHSIQDKMAAAIARYG